MRAFGMAMIFVGGLFLGFNVSGLARVAPAWLVIDQLAGAAPQLSLDRRADVLIEIVDAPCMVEEEGKCRIRANHLEVR